MNLEAPCHSLIQHVASLDHLPGHIEQSGNLTSLLLESFDKGNQKVNSFSLGQSKVILPAKGHRTDLTSESLSLT